MSQKRTSEQIVTTLCEKGGLRHRINGKCVDCIYDPIVPESWREQVHNCTAKDCPLYPVRAKSASQRVQATEKLG